MIRNMRLILIVGAIAMANASSNAVAAQGASGPLRVSEDNPRYFATPTGKIVYLVGSHTWSSLKDMGETDPPPAFDFSGYMDMLEHYGHNFIRLWTWELSRYAYSGKTTYAAPFPWPRTGPGAALDGKPKFDLSKLDQAYFDRLRERVELARDRGIYVSIMLFEGHGLHASDLPWCWEGHPFDAANNINGIDGDPDGDGHGIETQTLQIPAVTAIQEAYVRKVVDTVNDLDNVLYEIANESGAYSTEWQYHMIRLIHDYERGKPKQHPVGMTFQWAKKQPGSNANLFDSPADWVSPNPSGGYRDNPPAADGSKVILTDTDHLWGIGGNQQWVWKSFCRGMNPIFMDPCSPPIEARDAAQRNATWTDHLRGIAPLDPKWDPIRRSMGYTRRFAERMDLSRATPQNALASTGYCLANPGAEYLAYLPEGGEVTLDLTAAKGKLQVEWFAPSTAWGADAEPVPGGGKLSLTAPFSGDAVVFVHVTKPTEERSEARTMASDSVPANADRIRPWAQDSRYWQYKGEPVLLIGGSREDNLFQIPDLEEHLDLLASVGGNYIRNTMSDRDEGNVYPYQRLADGRYDLDQWNEEYWSRFASLLALTSARDIIVQIEVWDRFDLSDTRAMGNWQRHPYRPANNINYTEAETGLADAYPDHPAADKHPFYHTVPGMDQYRSEYDAVRKYQERFVAKMLSHSLPHGNVLYCMDNETSTDPRWGQHWMGFIRDKAREAGVDVCVTDMFDDGWMPERSEHIRLVLDHPELYDFIDISQVNSRNFGEDHWRRLRWVVQEAQANRRPVNHTKIYSAGETSFGSGTPQDGIERFWRNLLGGSASSRFHRPTSGIGLNETSQACLRSARKVEELVKFWDIEAHPELLQDRDQNEAYLAANPGQAYVLFFCRGGSVGLDMEAVAGPLHLRWLDIGAGEWGADQDLSGGAVHTVRAPIEGPSVAVIARP